MIKPFTIGSLSFPHNLIQGPLAGYSCAPFRRLFSQFIAPAYCVTEMISAIDLLHNKNPRSRYIWRDPQEGRLCYQLSGNCPTTLRAAAAIVADLGADLIDLNCGCPKPKIRKKKCGSSLLDQPQLIGELVTAIKSAVAIPVTVKIRVHPHQDDDSHLDAAKAAAQAGADALIVHGRHWSEDYQISCQKDAIREIVAAIDIPVIGNGDVSDIHSLKAMLETGCSGVMISRAGTGKPWLYQQLLAEISGKPYHPPSPAEVEQLFAEHIAGLAALENDHKAELQSRSLKRYYFSQGQV